MKPNYVKTANHQRFMDGLDALEERGADECRLLVVDGLPGLGKTTILSRWAADEKCIYLRAKTEWSSYWLLEELLTELRVHPPFGYAKRFNAAMKALGEQAHNAEITGRQFAVVIDEADHISRNGKLVETVRDLADIAGVPFVLVGMGRIRDNLARFPQVASRTSRFIRFEPADLKDVKFFLSEQCEVLVGDDLAKFIHKATGGFNREIREAIVAVERFGFLNPPSSPNYGLSLADMAGKHLINDRKSGQAIFVPGAA